MPIRHENLTRPAIKQFLDALPDLLYQLLWTTSQSPATMNRVCRSSEREGRMYRAMPTVMEDADELKRLMKQERHPLKRQRLQMLYLIASKQAQTRTALAPLLGVNRETVGDWLQLYAEGGREALLTIRTPPGPVPILPAPVVAELRERLSRPEGVGSYNEVRVWLFIVDPGICTVSEAGVR